MLRQTVASGVGNVAVRFLLVNKESKQRLDRRECGG